MNIRFDSFIHTRGGFSTDGSGDDTVTCVIKVCNYMTIYGLIIVIYQGSI